MMDITMRDARSVRAPPTASKSRRAIAAGRLRGALAAVLPCLLLAAGAPGLSPPRLLQRLREGGCVLVMRHAQSPEQRPTAAAAEPDNPRRERQLSGAGKTTARELGMALRVLGVPFGPIYVSPTYRAIETVRLAGIGPFRTVAQLAEGPRGMAGSAGRAEVRWLRRATDRPPPSGGNALIVTHTPNIVGAFGSVARHIGAAEMLVFEPVRHGTARFIGRLTVGQWRALAAVQH